MTRHHGYFNAAAPKSSRFAIVTRRVLASPRC
jgi:hypothetical protein